MIVADLVMSVDNVIAIAGAAESAGRSDHKMPLVIFGLLVSIPIIVWGSQLVIKLMDRFPMIITPAACCWAGSPERWPVTDPAAGRRLRWSLAGARGAEAIATVKYAAGVARCAAGAGLGHLLAASTGAAT